MQDKGAEQFWREELRRVSSVLLTAESTDEALSSAATELYELLLSVAHQHLQQDAGARILPTGKAISPADAARCTNDPVRTAMFLRGAAAAFDALSEQLSGCALEVVYAGTGPLAPLVVPLLASERWSHARVTFIDVNDASIAAVRRIVELLGDREMHRFIVADATSYQHGSPIHLVISETMQRALTVEPQVAIATNLVAQLHPLGVMIPECIRVDLCEATPAGACEIGTVMEVSLKAMLERNRGADRRLAMPRVANKVFYRTSIQTYREFHIPFNASGLTMPEYAWDLNDVQAGEVITFWYEVGERPGIRHHRKHPSRLVCG